MPRSPRNRAEKVRSGILAGRPTADMTFSERVWAVAARIPRGKVATYGDVARVLGTRAFRAVGMALHCNPYAPEVPCHRVVGCDGRMVGFAGGLKRKRQLLSEEGVEVVKDRVDLARYAHRLSPVG